MELLAQMPDFNYDDMPLDEVWYRTTDNKPLRPFDAGKALFDRTIISHTYENGFGVIKCDGPITKVNDDAFRVINNSKSENLSELYLPDGITSIGNFAILGNYYLSVLRIPDALKEIGKWGLQRNNNLRQFIGTKVSADGKCVIIDNILYAFAPKDLVSYAVPSGVEELAERAFAFSSIEEISLPDGLKTIGDRAFFDCSELKSITFPESLKIMGSSPFYGCNSLTGFYGNEKFHTSDNRCLINRGADYVELALFAAGSELSVYRIPDGITSLADYSFMDCKSLSKLYFPESVKFVWKNAFMNTANIKELAGPNVFSDKRSLIVDNKLLYVAGDGLTEYITPDHVEIIEEGAFRYNDDIERIVLSDNVKSVGYNCYSYSNYGNVFDQCFNLKEITISANMEELGEDLFSAAPWLTPTVEIVYCRAQVPPNASFYWNNSFEYDELTIYIPKGSLNAYLADAEWAKYSQYLKEYDYQDLPQNDPDLPDDGYVSIDYSQDGTVVAMQKAAEGNGINIVMMGDGYSDRQIADGMYAADMEYAYNNIFTIEPYKSFKDMFNISYVNVVSAAEGFDYGTTALDCGFGEGTRVYGDSGKCLSYAMNVVDEDEVDETLIIVVMNSDKFAGTCYSYYPETNSKDFGSGVAVAYFSKGSDEKKFAQLLHHEACGHGFAKLADEYSGLGTVPGDYAGQIQSQQSDWGWWKNVDFTDDPAQVLWSGFLKDARYANEGLGVFEGGLTYSKGVWRPTETSIMLHNIGGFNAPSREAIYYRIHKLAYGDEWEYDYETFVEWDARNRASVRAETAPQHRGGNYVEKAFEPLAPPVVINRTWKEALNASE